MSSTSHSGHASRDASTCLMLTDWATLSLPNRYIFLTARCVQVRDYGSHSYYSDTSANEDNSFRNHIRQPKLLAVSNVNNPVGLVCLTYVMWSAHFFVTHIQTEKISSWNGSTVHVCCFMLARASTKTFVSRIHIRQRVRKTAKKIFVSRKIRQQGHSLAEVSL